MDPRTPTIGIASSKKRITRGRSPKTEKEHDRSMRVSIGTPSASDSSIRKSSRTRERDLTGIYESKVEVLSTDSEKVSRAKESMIGMDSAVKRVHSSPHSEMMTAPIAYFRVR